MAPRSDIERRLFHLHSGPVNEDTDWWMMIEPAAG